MTIASEIARLQAAKDSIKDALVAQGVDVPEGTSMDDFPELIEKIGGAV